MSLTEEQTRFRNLLRRVLPNLFLLIEGEPRWSEIEKRMAKVYDKRKFEEKYSRSDYYLSPLECNFYDIVHLALRGDRQYLAIVKLFNIIFYRIYMSITGELKSKISARVKDKILGVFETDYRTYIGELLVYDVIISNGNYDIVDCDKKLMEGSNKDADWYIQDRITREYFFIDVVNYTLVNDDRQYNLRKIVSGLTEKTNYKVGESIIRENFSIFPIIWSSSTTIIKNLAIDMLSVKIDVNYNGPFTLLEDKFVPIYDI